MYGSTGSVIMKFDYEYIQYLVGIVVVVGAAANAAAGAHVDDGDNDNDDASVDADDNDSINNNVIVIIMKDIKANFNYVFRRSELSERSLYVFKKFQ